MFDDRTAGGGEEGAVVIGNQFPTHDPSVERKPPPLDGMVLIGGASSNCTRFASLVRSDNDTQKSTEIVVVRNCNNSIKAGVSSSVNIVPSQRSGASSLRSELRSQIAMLSSTADRISSGCWMMAEFQILKKLDDPSGLVLFRGDEPADWVEVDVSGMISRHRTGTTRTLSGRRGTY